MNRLSFEPGENCWRVASAERFALIVDGADYFRALRETLFMADRLITLVGWDFDFEIEMLPGESDDEGNAPDGFPNQIGPFLEALVDRRPELEIYLLKWSGGALIAPGRLLPTAHIKLLSPDQVHLGFDGRHPIGACHHQKIVVVDDSLAFCGGIDVTDGRWDQRDHAPNNPLRHLKNGEIAQPWHDATTVISGDAAAELGKLCRMRWARAQDSEMDEPFTPGMDRWPDSIEPDFRNIDIAISRTEPPGKNHPPITEIEALYLESIAAAQDYIYLESQYFSSDEIASAIAQRLQEPDGPEVIVINPVAAQVMLEDEAMHVTRSRFIRHLAAHDPHGRFRILYPSDSANGGIYVHAKITIFDDCFLRVGSSNIDRRSLGFDTECDVALLADSEEDRRTIRGMRDSLIAEHLGREKDEVGQEIERRDSIIAAIDALNRPTGKGLRPIHPRKETFLGSLLADTRFFDPRYRSSAAARLGLTSRHVMYGAAAALAVGAIWWSRSRRR
ncbi:phospholipase D-like domain-containing protein [Paracoccus albus]|uniref:phospholipase D-like domain-containing protein n=1 Tax=Paracoccus albus TaxID=3017784 RepID=UPI0022F0E418|nr:phospholipase D-like domain-containing protein [Paracoccus albus]WBU60167.1 phospholipase D-like domain-containing protein [Paracoccus albus]